VTSDEPNEQAEVPMTDARPMAEWTPDGHVTEPTVHAWLDGALAGAEADAVSAHVASCAACGALAAEVRGVIAASVRIVGLLDAAPARPRVVGGGGSAPRTPPRAWYRRPAVLSMAAMLLLAVGVRTVWREGGQPAAAPFASLPATDSAPVVSQGASEAASGVASAEADFYGKGAAVAAPRPLARARPSAPPLSPSLSPLPSPKFSPPAPPPPPAVAELAPAPAPAPRAAMAMVAPRASMAREMASAAPGLCYVVEAPEDAGIALPAMMQLMEPLSTTAPVALAWVDSPPGSGRRLGFTLRQPRPDSLAGSDDDRLDITVTLIRDGDGWRGTATASGDGAPYTRTFRLRSTNPSACAGR
jgi:hypothetical protein